MEWTLSYGGVRWRKPDEEAAVAAAHRLAVTGRASAGDAALVLGSERARRVLMRESAHRLWDGEERVLRLPGLRDAQVVLSRRDGSGVLDLRTGRRPYLSAVYHPLARLLPVVSEDYCTVATRPLREARLEYVHDDLVVPRRPGRTREDDVRGYLGRLIASRGANGRAQRFVEPGVGRSYLVDFVRVDGRPELVDFSVTGVGLTPFAEAGFLFRGANIDGFMPLIRARQRARLAETLDAAGCRTAAVVAIVTAPRFDHTMPDGSALPAALLVRGFRNVLRVKQLDPLANLLMSNRHRRAIQVLLARRIWEGDPTLRGIDVTADEPATSFLDRSSWPCTCLIPGFVLGHRPGRRCDETTPCRVQRMQVMLAYAGAIVEHARRRVAAEVGRDPEGELLTVDEYIRWFAERMGAQLASMKRARFLHDYRAARQDWHDPLQLMNSLSDTNVTLAAELADLETGVLVDDGSFEAVEQLRISVDELETLRHGYDDLHAHELRLARGIVQTVAFVASGGDETRTATAAAEFARAYDRLARDAPAARRRRREGVLLQ